MTVVTGDRTEPRHVEPCRLAARFSSVQFNLSDVRQCSSFSTGVISPYFRHKDTWRAALFWQTCCRDAEYALAHLKRLSWWRHQMETFSASLAICAGNSPVPGEFPAQRPVTRSFDVFLDRHPNKRLSKQWWGWWFETFSCPLWRHRNVTIIGGRCHCRILSRGFVKIIPNFTDGILLIVYFWQILFTCWLRLHVEKHNTKIPVCPYTWHNRLITSIDDSVFLCPLLLTWFNFNPGMDK